MNEHLRTRRIARFGLTTPDARRLAGFYESAFDCRLLAADRAEGTGFETLMNVRGGALRLTLALGGQSVELLEFDEPGQPYPLPLSPLNLVFQHFAIVVGDMPRALQRLARIVGWSAISTGGAQELPQRSGGVTAFKFRDPDGHPLEFLAFPKDRVPAHWRACGGDGLFLGIDHSAISIGDTSRSIAFYGGLGFRVASQSLNHGIEQQNLDGIDDPRTEVSALAADEDTPHLELLCYRTGSRPQREIVRSNDTAATRLVIEMETATELPDDLRGERMVLDPDGHRLQLYSVSAGAKKTNTVSSSSIS